MVRGLPAPGSERSGPPSSREGCGRADATTRARVEARGDDLDVPWVALVPISVHRPEQDNPYGNFITSLIVPIPTDEADPARRLVRSHDAMFAAKERHRSTPASLLTMLVPCVWDLVDDLQAELESLFATIDAH
jgi:hypothetical protein